MSENPPPPDLHEPSSQVEVGISEQTLLQERIKYAEEQIRNHQNNKFKKLSCEDLFGTVESKQVSLNASAKVTAQCHVLFDLQKLFKEKKSRNVDKHRFKQGYGDPSQADAIKKRFCSLLAAVWELDQVPADLDVNGLQKAGCWNEHQGYINQMIATLTGVLENRPVSCGIKRDRVASFDTGKICLKCHETASTDYLNDCLLCCVKVLKDKVEELTNENDKRRVEVQEYRLKYTVLLYSQEDRTIAGDDSSAFPLFGRIDPASNIHT